MSATSPASPMSPTPWGRLQPRSWGRRQPSKLPAKPNPYVDPSASKMPAKDNPYADKIVKMIALKLKAGRPMSASDMGLLSSAAKEGNANAQKLLVVLESRGVAQKADTSGLESLDVQAEPQLLVRIQPGRRIHRLREERLGRERQAPEAAGQAERCPRRGEKAAQAAQAVAAAKEQSAATEAQLKEIGTPPQGIPCPAPSWGTRRHAHRRCRGPALDKAGKRKACRPAVRQDPGGADPHQDELKPAAESRTSSAA